MGEDQCSIRVTLRKLYIVYASEHIRNEAGEGKYRELTARVLAIGSVKNGTLG